MNDDTKIEIEKNSPNNMLDPKIVVTPPNGDAEDPNEATTSKIPSELAQKNKQSIKNYRVMYVFKLVTSVILITFYISMILMGWIHISECPLDKHIPIWNIFYGSIGIIYQLFSCFIFVSYDLNLTSKIIPGLVYIILNLLQLSLLMMGAIWFYRIVDYVSFDEADLNYCKYDFYYFSMWTIVAMCFIKPVGPFLFCA